MLEVRDEHNFIGVDLMPVEFVELFQLFNQVSSSAHSLHVYIIILTILCRLKIVECKRGQIYGTGFISPNTVNEWTVQKRSEDTEENLLKAFLRHQNKREILFPSNFKWVLSDIGFRQNPWGSNSGVRTKIFSLPKHALSLAAIAKLDRWTTQETRGLYWFGPPLWCNTLIQCVVWWIASWADDEQ